MASLRLFAGAREAAGRSRDTFEAASVAELLDQAALRYGAAFTAVLAGSRVWLNGDEAVASATIGPADEVAVLPPVSGGAGAPAG